jgi:hypothetical protein
MVGILGVVDRLEHLYPALGPVIDDQLQGAQNRHIAGSPLVEVLPETVLQKLYIDHGIRLGYADPSEEIPDGLGRVAPAPQARQGGHARVVPARHLFLLHQADEPALGKDSVSQVEPGELYLP